MARPLYVLLLHHRVDSFGDVAEDVIYVALAVHREVKAEIGVIVLQRFGGLAVHFEAPCNSLEVVVGASRFAAALQHTLDEFILCYFESDDAVDFGAAFLKQFFEGFGLRYGAGKTVEDNAVLASGFLFEHIVEDFGHDGVGDKLAFADILVGEATEVGVSGYMVAQHVAGGDVIKAVLVNDFGALGALSAARCAE